MPTYDITQDTQWWTYPDDVLHQRVIAIAEGIRKRQQWRQVDLLNYARLYGGRAFEASLRHSILNLTGSGDPPSLTQLPRVALNIIKSMVDTAVAKLSVVDVKATVLTNGGTFDDKQEAESLDDFVSGIFYATGLRTLAPQLLTDAGVWGTGVAKVHAVAGKVEVERTLMLELFIDELDGMYGQPRQLFQQKAVDVGMLCARFPKYRHQIRAARRVSREDGNATISELVEVWEAWHLPSGEGAKDGKHCIVIDGCTLFSEKWTRKDFPFVFLHWARRLVGFWGVGIAESLLPLQVEINRLLRTIQLSLHLNGVPRVFVENGSEVDVATINNDIGAVITYTGIKPEFGTSQSVPADLRQHLENLIQKSYEMEGINQSASQSRKSAGVTSGVAIRTEADLQTERFSVKQKVYEQSHLDVARQAIELAADLDQQARDGEEDGEAQGYKITVPGPRFAKTLRFPKALRDLGFLLQVYPTNMLPKTPEGRLSAIQEYMQAGLLMPEEGRMLLDFPDLASVTGLEDAPLKFAFYLIDGMLKSGEPAAISPYMDKALVLKMSQRAHMKARMDSAPASRLAALEAFIDALTADLANTQKPPAANDTPPPMANPTAPPVSDLLANVPQQGAA